MKRFVSLQKRLLCLTFVATILFSFAESSVPVSAYFWEIDDFNKIDMEAVMRALGENRDDSLQVEPSQSYVTNVKYPGTVVLTSGAKYGQLVVSSADSLNMNGASVQELVLTSPNTVLKGDGSIYTLYATQAAIDINDLIKLKEGMNEVVDSNFIPDIIKREILTEEAAEEIRTIWNADDASAALREAGAEYSEPSVRAIDEPEVPTHLVFPDPAPDEQEVPTSRWEPGW